MNLSRVITAVASALLLASTLPAARSLSAQTTAATPPMGWNSWNHFKAKVDDKTIRATADAIVASGMRDAGYLYVNIDDTWEGKRDAQGNITTNEKFPDMKALADYVHSKGLKLGIYSSPGPQTCAHYEGSFGHEAQDAKTYAAWGIDYLKYDLCSFRKNMQDAHPNDPAAQAQMMKDAYIKMRDALKATGRPIVYSLCQYGNDAVWEWGPSVGGNLWRTTGDISDNYNSMSSIGFSQAGLAPFAGPGHWNDPDMLEVGNGGMKPDEYRTHMTLWAILAAPLLAGNDVANMTDETKSILLNRDVIAIDQDKLGKQGDRVWVQGPIEVWTRPLANGAKAVAIFNRHPQPMTPTINLGKLGIIGKAHDIWAAKDMPLSSTWKQTIPGHGVVLMRVSR